jgi:hypothetical protein
MDNRGEFISGGGPVKNDMRPSVDVPSSEQYECPDCGRRVESPDGRECECGGILRDLTNSRDL